MSVAGKRRGERVANERNVVSLEAHWIGEAEARFAGEGADSEDEEPDHLGTVAAFFEAVERLASVKLVVFTADLESILYGEDTIDELERQL